jgi:6-pyruvoyltetrahydropterin/6-carboxytetrahydropterin synthase
MITCTKRWDDFPFGHKQPNHAGHCRFIHGHNWSFEFTFAAKRLDSCGFVMDFGRLKSLKAKFDELFDHTFLINEDDPDRAWFEAVAGGTHGQRKFLDLRVVPDCSCEGIVKHAYEIANEHVHVNTAGRVRVTHVRLWEDSKNSATYTRDDGEFLPGLHEDRT